MRGRLFLRGGTPKLPKLSNFDKALLSGIVMVFFLVVLAVLVAFKIMGRW